MPNIRVQQNIRPHRLSAVNGRLFRILDGYISSSSHTSAPYLPKTGDLILCQCQNGLNLLEEYRKYNKDSINIRMLRISFISLMIISAVLFGCARTYQSYSVEKAGFLGDYTLLKEGGDDEALLSYWKNGVDWKSYKKIILDPVIINSLEDSELSEITHAQRHGLKELLETRLREALKRNFMFVNKPGADTMRIQYAITDAETSIVLLDMFSSVYPSARTLSALKHLVTGTESFVGKASVEAKILDSVTGNLLMASADARAGGKTLTGLTNEWDDVEQAYYYWANQLNFQLCQRQGRIVCTKPEVD